MGTLAERVAVQQSALAQPRQQAGFTACGIESDARADDPEMHQTKKGNQWYFGMKAHIGTPAADLLHGEETVVYADAGYQGVEKRDEMQGRGNGFRVAMRPGKRRVLPQTPEGRLDDLIETAYAHIRAKGKHPFRVMKQQFGFQKTRLRGMLKNRCKVNGLAALSNLFMARRRLLGSTWGAKSFPQDIQGVLVKGQPHHPIVEDDVVMYAGATILGRVTIGRGAQIGGNVWLTSSVPPETTVTQVKVLSETFGEGGGI
jgi:IS5 family transposase